MKWLILALAAEVSVLVCLIFAFDGALHSVRTMKPTWDHAAVFVIYAFVRVWFSRMRSLSVPSPFLPRQGVPPRLGRHLPSGS
jgi:hypothetical protein